ncbi:hypothetical protein QTQ03_06710 [Micromonospora sp. WMMA1363]|uniref:hypothetical protein n=1 Tax=Micromonospora sp. WMMA1363 TaxID=3053985 RepID=UPI00259CC900|nr:hypothetical protein [Micromonospora sp. WMMA1363]MDM4719302.1 hypothetical protein [Micromonospora sp. WMMA1363]
MSSRPAETRLDSRRTPVVVVSRPRGEDRVEDADGGGDVDVRVERADIDARTRRRHDRSRRLRCRRRVGEGRDRIGQWVGSEHLPGRCLNQLGDGDDRLRRIVGENTRALGGQQFGDDLADDGLRHVGGQDIGDDLGERADNRVNGLGHGGLPSGVREKMQRRWCPEAGRLSGGRASAGHCPGAAHRDSDRPMTCR